MGQPDPLVSPHEVYLQLAPGQATRQDAYRALFRHELDGDAIGGIRLALNQGQPLGNSRFIDSSARTTGTRREPKPRGRPRKLSQVDNPGEHATLEI